MRWRCLSLLFLASGLAAMACVPGGPLAVDDGNPQDEEQSPPPEVAGAQYFTDFSEYDTGRLPGDWTERFDTRPTWTVEEVAGTTGGKVLRAYLAGGESYAERMLSWNAIDGDPARADVEILTRLRTTTLQTGNSRHAGIAARGSGSVGDESSLQVALYESDSRGDGTVLRVLVSGDGETLAEDGEPWRPDIWYHIRLRAEGSTVKVRRWAGSLQDEPDTWAIEHTVERLEDAGWVGAHFRRKPSTPRSGVHEWDFLGVGTGGAPAPSGPVNPS